MSELVTTYLVAIFGMLFAATSAFTLIYTIDHLDAPETSAPSPTTQETVAV